MRRLRLGLLVSTVASACVAACGDDFGSSQADGGSSGSSGSSGASGSSGTPVIPGTPGTDAGRDAAPDPIPAKVQLVNAVTDLGPGTDNTTGALRMCFQIPSPAGKIFTPGLPPLPNRKTGTQPFPGLAMGTGGPVPTTGADLSTLEVTPYLISAGKLDAVGVGSTVTPGNDQLCADLFDGAAGVTLTLNTDYWILPPIAAGELAQKNSYLLVLTGCTGDSTVSASKCGSGHSPGGAPGNGNLKITKLQLDNTTVVDAAKLGAQFVHASPNLNLESATGGEGVRPAITSNPFDQAAAKPLTDPVANVAFGTITPLKQIAGVTFPTDSVVANPKVSQVASPFGTIETLSFGTQTGAAYGYGKPFTFIALGDPTNSEPNPPSGFNLRKIHFLGLPNDPVIPTFDPTK